jgi:hypothetical protein
VITIRVLDRVEGRIWQRTIEAAPAGVAIALLVALFARPELDPWAVMYPRDGEPAQDIAITTAHDGNGDLVVIVERGLQGDDDLRVELMPS